MKVTEALSQIKHLKPNQYDDRMLVKWLSDLDGQIYNEIVKWHDGAPENPPAEYDPVADLNTELLAQGPYADVYVKYMAAQIDYYNAEFDRYNNSMIMFNMALSAYADWYNRNNVPEQKNFVRW